MRRLPQSPSIGAVLDHVVIDKVTEDTFHAKLKILRFTAASRRVTISVGAFGCPRREPSPSNMPKHVQRQIELVKEKILFVGSMVERAIANAMAALAERDETLAAKALEEHAEIDRREVNVEEHCLKILALYQPVAADLRFVVAVRKIKNDLERMGDLAVDIAKRVVYPARVDRVDVPDDFCGMAVRAQHMVKRSLDALVRGDSALAHQVRQDDDELDAMRRRVREQIRAAIRERPQRTEALINLYSIARRLARLGDMAANVANEVICMVGPGKGGSENG